MAEQRTLRTNAQRWLVRMDPELMRDIDFHDQCGRPARMAYVDSMFYIALRGGPEDIYPHAVLAGEFGADASMAARDLLCLGAWLDCGLGYQVIPYAGWRVVPEQRLHISPATRRAVYERDGYRCRLCGRSRDLTLDNICPWSLGGSDEISNLQTLCRPCNCRKGARV